MTAAAATTETFTPPKITQEFSEAFDLLEHTRCNVFLTGKAGTGKSTFLQYFRENTTKKMAVVAPTGVAALNVQGQTIHSFFRLKPTFINLAEFKPGRRRIFKELELLIIDEISMVRADIFDGIDHTLRFARKNNKPFGGVQLCVIGDLFQLPPVITNEEKSFYGQYYRSPFFFCTRAYEAGNFRAIQFNTVHRQNDAAFIQILNAIRAGTCDAIELEALNSRVNAKATPAPGTLVLTTTNALAENINTSKLARLSGNSRSFEGTLEGEFGMRGTRLPAPEQLTLKPGAQVMFSKNDTEGRWVNGTIGVVKDINRDSITVQVGDNSYDVERTSWQSIGYEVDKENDTIKEKPLGSYTQFPLMLAWAITIHKSQGKTLERVIIDLGSGAFAAGQLYVALSRCKSLTGIALKQPITPADIRCDFEVVAFMQELANQPEYTELTAQEDTEQADEEHTDDDFRDVLRLLAGGIDPITKQRLPDTSPCHHPKVVQALKAALAASGSRQKPKREAGDDQPANHGKPWTQELKDYVADVYKGGAAIKDIATELQRTKGSILSELIKQELITFNDASTTTPEQAAKNIQAG